jgi:glycosyltransferase involved in cell wall biosynthesis
MQADTVRFAVIVPAYRPEESLLNLIDALSEKSISAIVLVDDGSGPAYREIFRRAAEFEKVRLVRHAVNLGKGAALKTGINYALCTFPELQGVITADADGQHHPDDIEQVADKLAAEPDRIVLGTRSFGGDVPLRSRVGNVVTRIVMGALVGQHVSDTQTGLRGIPAALLPHLLRLEANGYDFELDMLIAVRQQAIRIAEVPIRTIYEPGNRTSHFNPLIDSMKIYFVLLRFSSVSLMAAALDTLVFYLAYRRLGNVAASQALGRLVAVAFNYSMVRRAVFFSKLRHASVLPKYLLLVCLSGVTSYAGIQLLNSRFHIQLLPAKLLVETLLFFANFAIQRDFIFGKSPGKPGQDRSQPSWIDKVPRWIPPAVLAALGVVLLGIVLHGFRAERILLNSGWTPIGQYRLIHYAKIFWAASLAILLSLPAAFAPIVALLVAAATAIAIGPVALLAVVAFLIGSCALGSKLMRTSDDPSPENQLCATLLGIAIYIFLMTFMARLPVNYPAVYLVLLGIPALTDIRGVWRRMVSWGKALMPTRKRPRLQVAAFALLVFVLGMHWLIVPQPESSADGLAMHLAIPVNISLHHVMTYRPDRIFWSVMPMGADWCYTIVYLLGGEFAARLLNFAMLLLVEAVLYRAARRFVSPAIAFVILALFASTSLVQLVTGSLFVENFLAAMVVGMAAAIWQFGDTGKRRYLYAAAVLGGTTLATKIGGVAYVVAALPVAIVEVRNVGQALGLRRPPRPPGSAVSSGIIAVLLLLAAALPTYVISWRLTGDPVFPFLNQTFPSPIVDRNVSFVDPRYKQTIAFHTPYDLTFHTERYGEGRPGSLGFHYLLLVPLGLIALLAVRRRPALSAAVVSISGALIILRFLPNDRYLYPSLPLMLVPLAALLGWLEPVALRRAFITLAVLCVVVNTWFLPASNYYHSDFYEHAPLSRAMRQVYIDKNAPIREIGEYMNREHPGAPVFLADGSDLAAFNAEVYSNGWHQFGVFMRLFRARDAQEIAGILNRWNVHYIVAPKPGLGITINPPALRDLINNNVTPEFQTKWLFVGRIGKQVDREPSIVSPGSFDDFDPAIAYRGSWNHEKGWTQAHAQTISFSNLPGSEIRFAFQGVSLTYLYTKAPNRGMADVVIDGVRKATLDVYSPKVEWQSRTTYKLGSGRHVAVITVLPEKNPKSSDRFIDVDGFEVQ